MRPLAALACYSSLFLLAPTSVAQPVVCKVDIAPGGAHLGCTEQTKNRACTTATGKNSTCTGTIECSCPEPPKTGGSTTAHRFDEASVMQLASARSLAGKKQQVTIKVPIRFTQQPDLNQTVAFLPNGEVLREQTALTGGAATMSVSSTPDPFVLAISIDGLSLEAKGFSFTAVQPAVTGTLNLQTGLFEVAVFFKEFETPETRTPFEWRGTAYGQYDFSTGVVRVIESGTGSYLVPSIGR